MANPAASTTERKMLELILEMLNREFPVGKSTIDVTSEICGRIDMDEILSIKSLDLPNLGRTISSDRGTHIISIKKNIAPYAERELRIVLHTEKENGCAAYVFTTYL